MLRPYLEVEMFKKCTVLWHEAHVEVKLSKTAGPKPPVSSLHDETKQAVVARSTSRNQNLSKTDGVGPCLEDEMLKSARSYGAKRVAK